MEDFVRKSLGVRDIKSLPLNTSKELDLVADVEGRIYIKIQNVYKELLFDDYTEVIKELLSRVSEVEVSDKVTKIEIEAIKTKLLEIDKNANDIATLQAELPLIIQRMTNIEGQFTGINVRLNDLETTINSLGDVELVKSQLAQNTTDIAKNKTDIAKNTSDISSNKQLIDSNTRRYAQLDDKIQTEINTQVSVNASQNTRLNTLESKVADTAWTQIIPTAPFYAITQVQIKRQNGIVYMRGTLAHTPSNNGIGDCFTIPEGFRMPGNSYEYHFLLPGQSSTQSDMAKIYVRPSGVCSIASKSGTTSIFLEPIQYSLT